MALFLRHAQPKYRRGQEINMSRLLFSIAFSLSIGLIVAGCGSTGGNNLTDFGYAPNDGVLSYGGNGQKKRLTKEGAKQQRFASLSDKAPRGSYSKAKKGAFKKGDYNSTKLNPATAREMINAYRISKGLKPLRLNNKLAAAAKMHAKDLAAHDRI
jgi:hypothetical protein